MHKSINLFAIGGLAALALAGCKQENNYPEDGATVESTTTAVVPVPGPASTATVAVPVPGDTVVVPVPGPTVTQTAEPKATPTP
ncbi:MAG: hypothetical protein ACREBO_09360 [Novosphingobium sp.]